ncbi:hypothetical protein ACFORJ_04340 [Corynebacterium hansenii]|uniref:Secreted protein n=1 Tax=Corynebacterium hansenii TaxID=394964 RepID=A0ABV7ZPK6_9CORY|nr:hypothetical protein [Corynebacterium hansenii]WJY98776.1 hypothetical protein CHAN_00665 [Corynebacterium hansenii]
MKNTTRIARAAAAAGIAAAMAIGAAAPASAQIKPVLPDLGSLMPGMPASSAEKVRLGETGGLIWKGEIYKQVTRGATVIPGGLVTTRLEVRGMTNRGEKLREIADIMPEGFELVSVTRMKENALGEALHVVPANDYTNVPVANGMREVRLSWTEGGFLGLFADNPTVSTSKSVVVDFTYRAPRDLGQYQHGAFFRMGSAIAPEFRTETGGTPITVENSPKAAFGSLGSS